jgi:hypothetical protein
MQARHRRSIGICGLVMAATLTAAVPVAGAARAQADPAPTWHLVDYHQHGCYDTHVHDLWAGVYVRGRWAHRLSIGMARLPAGGTYRTTYAPIAPGSSDGQGSLAYTDTTLPASTPIGAYTVWLWVSDGTTRQHVPVTLNVKASCGY